MKRTPVESSNVESVGYDASKRILEVGFKGGTVYQYSEVPSTTHEALMKAGSVGSFLHREIKSRYECKKIA